MICGQVIMMILVVCFEFFDMPLLSLAKVERSRTPVVFVFVILLHASKGESTLLGA